jgi:3-hydroxyisobutyrate dehydrogenase-like beta-hydroxyacid dehydrogenase
VLLASTIAPGDVDGFATRIAATPGELVGTPISGGPKRAHDGTMTMMVAGSAAALERCAPVFAAIAGNVFRVGTRPADAARFKVINNLLAAVNLAAGAEAMALAVKAGLDPRQLIEVINASSGGSWIFADRMPRALAGDYAPRAATRVLCKDAGLAVDFAEQHGVAAPFARAAQAAFASAVAAGFGEHDDAALYEWSRREAGL